MLQTTENYNIMTVEQVKHFLQYHLDYIGLGFHPDTDFEDYINFNTDETLYSEKSAKVANMQISQCFDVCEKNDIDIYELTMSLY